VFQKSDLYQSSTGFADPRGMKRELFLI
jgi:hypothetical protein